MTWLLRWIVDLVNSFAAWYYRRKYGAAARRLGRPPHEEDGQHGFIILEIDGLSYEHLRWALKQGALPTLGRMLTRRRLRLARWHFGLPSTTPASQAGILYGHNWDIPGFRWYDKASGDPVTCRVASDARAVQERISAGRSGLLRGGSSYTNMFDGGARLALFTLAALGRDRLFENVRGLGFVALFALSAVRLTKVVALSLWTWLVYVAKRALALVRSSNVTFTFWGPVSEILNNVVFREVTTFSVMVDVYRGMPAIYASYTGYDDIAHHFGATSKEALRALKGMDSQIRQIDRIRQLYMRREYDLHILSDHGQTPSVPFRRQFGQTLQEFIATHTGQEVWGEPEAGVRGGPAEAAIRVLLDELRGLEDRPHRPWMAQLMQNARQRLESRFEAAITGGEWDWARRGEIVVQNSGPLAHVYFRVTPRPMDLSEVAVLFPGLPEALVAHPGIGLVVAREAEDVVVAGREGTLWLAPGGRRVEGETPLTRYGDAEWAEGQVARLARFPHAGDLILLGAWDGQSVVSFEDQVATHGGLGGPQTWPFLASTSRERMPAGGIEGAEQVYVHLVQAYGSYE
jgi:hypothetical protein